MEQDITQTGSLFTWTRCAQLENTYATLPPGTFCRPNLQEALVQRDTHLIFCSHARQIRDQPLAVDDCVAVCLTSYATSRFEILVAGVVSEPACQISQEGEHEKGPRSAGAQCAPANLLRRAHLARGVGEEGAGEAGEEVAKTVGKATKEAAGT